MVGGDQNTSNKIQLLVNYWEVRPSALAERVDAILRSGMTHVATFVPWQAVESDISHTLPRFLQMLRERRVSVSLILTPELGVHYANSGLPKDLFSKSETLARDSHGQSMVVSLAPGSFSLPSLLSPEFGKRYFNFLSRVDSLLAELERTQPSILEGVTVVLTGSLWKYYRSPRSSFFQSFSSLSGDYSGSAAVAFRQGVERFYSQREFSEAGLAAANRWKTRQLEDVNRRWFNQQSEDQFRVRSAQHVRKKAVGIRVRQVELFTPEADPAFNYAHLLQLVTGARADFNRLSTLIDEFAVRESGAPGGVAPSYFHWTGLGGFRTLTDAEKQFLILKSLLLSVGRTGGILIDESEWFSLSHSFRARAESLARAIANEELLLRNRALYWMPHLWSGAGQLWETLSSQVGTGARMIASLDLALQDRDAQILVVDPNTILTRKQLLQLVEWAKTGRVVVLPRTPLYSDAARAELEKIAQEEGKRRGSMEIDLGISYRLYPLAGGAGRLVVFDLPEGVVGAELLQSLQTFVSSLLSIAGIQPVCSVSDHRLKTLFFEKRSGGLGVFVLNSSARPVSGDLFFQSPVQISDLSLSLGAAASSATTEGATAAPASRYSLEVPSRGIFPISVDGLDGVGRDVHERREAQRAAEMTRSAPTASARNELPGFDPAGGSLWN